MRPSWCSPRAALCTSLSIFAIAATSSMAQVPQNCINLCKSSWNQDEQFAWLRICSGEVADFNVRKGELGGMLSPNCWNGGRIPSEKSCWGSDRTISSRFLSDILFDESLRVAIPQKGIRIVGAHFPDVVDLTYAHIPRNIFLDNSRFDHNVNMPWIRADRSVSFDGSFIGGQLNMEGARIDGNLWVRKSNPHQGAFRPAIGHVNLKHANIEGQTSISGAAIRGGLDMDSAVVGADLFMRGSSVATANLLFANIGSNLVIADATLGFLDLSGATIGKELRLVENNRAPSWADGALINLLNTQVKALVEAPDAWPSTVRADGFVYVTLGGFGKTTKEVALERSLNDEFVWLSRSDSTSLQPYEQLAKVLRIEGRERSAVQALFEGRELERSTTRGLVWLWLTALKLVVGYGYTPFSALFWAGGLVGLGCLVLCSHGTKRNNDIIGPVGFWFSLDYLLPIIELNQDHFSKVDMHHCVRWYFYVHQILGYVLVLFVVAGLNGVAR